MIKRIWRVLVHVIPFPDKYINLILTSNRRWAEKAGVGTPEYYERLSASWMRVHSIDACDGDPCPLHSPSDHHMRDWPLIWRQDRYIFERVCPDHGVGHPDPDSVRELSDSIHGCCGCCSGV